MDTRGLVEAFDRTPGMTAAVRDGVCGLEVEPADAVLIRYRDIIAMREEDRSRRLVLTLTDGREYVMPVSPTAGWRSRAARRHDHAQQIIEIVEARR